MTSEGLRPRRREPSKAGSVASLRSNLGARFAVLMQVAGLRVPKGVSLSAVALIRDMVAAGGTMPRMQSKCSARPSDGRQPAVGMGLIIKHGYARYVPDAKHYELTPEGRGLLASAEAKGLMKTLAEFEGLLREAAAREQGSLGGTLKREQRTLKGEHDA